MESSYKKLYWLMGKEDPMTLGTHIQRHRLSHHYFQNVNGLTSHIAGTVNKHQKSPSCKIVNMSTLMNDQQLGKERIHNNRIQVHPRSTSQNIQTQQWSSQAKSKLKRKDIYDNQIEKYISLQHSNEQILQKYLTNREQFLREACMDIQNQIKQQIPLNRKVNQRQKSSKTKAQLPKIDQLSYMLKKTTHYSYRGPYMQDISQIKKAQELGLKDRKRKMRTFKLRMNSLENQLDKMKKSFDY